MLVETSLKLRVASKQILKRTSKHNWQRPKDTESNYENNKRKKIMKPIYSRKARGTGITNKRLTA
jgi:hypothetical protein